MGRRCNAYKIVAEKDAGKETTWKERGVVWEDNIKTDGMVWTGLFGLCIDRPKYAVANSKLTRRKLLSACNNVKRLCFRCENLWHNVNAADVVHDSPPRCNQPILLLNTNFSTNIVALIFGDFLLSAVRCFYEHYYGRRCPALDQPLTLPRMSEQNYLRRALVTVALVVLMPSSILIKGKTRWKFFLACFTTTGNRYPRPIYMCARKQSRKFEYSMPDMV
jgi:hypothetical protein